MELEMLAKDPNSVPDGCPSVYRAEDGSLVVQGPLVDSGTWGNVKNPLPGEGAVHIAPEVVLEAVRRLGL